MMDSNARRRGICSNLLWRAMPLMLATAFKWKTRASGGMIYPAWYESWWIRCGGCTRDVGYLRKAVRAEL